MPFNPKDPFGIQQRRDAIRGGLDRMAQPSDDNVLKAQILGGLAGAGRTVYDFLAGDGDDTVDPMIGVSPAASIGQKALPVVAKEAYSAVKGLPGLFSRLTDSIVQRMPERAFPSKIQSIAKSGASSEEIGLRKLDQFLSGRNPQQVITKEEVLAHLDQNPIDLKVKTLRNQEDVKNQWFDETKAFENEVARRQGRNVWDPDNLLPEEAARMQELLDREPPQFGAPGADVMYREYQVPGGQDYRETLLKAPKFKDPPLPELPDISDIPAEVQEGFQEYGKLGMERAGGTPEHLDRLVDYWSKQMHPRDYGWAPAKQYQSPHWPEDWNVLLHTRSNNRSLELPKRNEQWDLLRAQINEQDEGLENFRRQRFGENWMEKAFTSEEGLGTGVLPEEVEFMRRRQALQDQLNKTDRWIPATGDRGRLIEEIQSDLHQEGRKVGYGPPKPEAERESQLRELEREIYEIGRRTRERNESGLYVSSEVSPEDRARLEELDDLRTKVMRQPVPDLPFKDSWADLGLKEQLLDVANDPDLGWLGILGPEAQVSRFPDQANVKGMQHFYGEEYPNKLAKLLRPFGGKVEKVTLPRTSLPATYVTRNHQVLPVEPDGTMGSPIASALLPQGSPEYYTANNQLLAALQDRQDRGIMPPGPEISMARITPEMKEMIKKIGFPAMMALLGLRAAPPHERGQQ